MYYKSRIYQLNSLRLGLITEDNIFGKPTIFIAMGSQTPEVTKLAKRYQDLYTKNNVNLVAIPFDNDGTEPGDNYEIYTYYENVLGFKFYVTEKISDDHIFFTHFGKPTKNFTEYHFDKKTKFIEKI
tara:strand:+ start:583 stop:963 length:381 start_codon:yes stop_codon:yes gene_type:complete